MTIQDLGSLGEFVAATATLGTLVYSAVQIRQNKTTVRASTIQSAIQFSVGFAESINRDAEVSALFDRGIADLKSLGEAERSRFSYMMIGFFRMSPNSHHWLGQGLSDAETWHPMAESILRFVDQPGSREWWRDKAGRFSVNFRELIDRELEHRTA